MVRAGIIREVMAVFKGAWLPFADFIILSGFIVVNLIVAVIYEAISALDTQDGKAKLHGIFDDTEGTDLEASSYPTQETQ
jgi:hypothetical protein